VVELANVSREHVKVKCPHEPYSGMMWWWTRKTEPQVATDSHHIAIYWLHFDTIRATGLSKHTMASIEALYIFDEHKYVSNLAIDLHALAHLSDHAAAT
jgi:hypothetical protein